VYISHSFFDQQQKNSPTTGAASISNRKIHQQLQQHQSPAEEFTNNCISINQQQKNSPKNCSSIKQQQKNSPTTAAVSISSRRIHQKLHQHQSAAEEFTNNCSTINQRQKNSPKTAVVSISSRRIYQQF